MPLGRRNGPNITAVPTQKFQALKINSPAIAFAAEANDGASKARPAEKTNTVLILLFFALERAPLLVKKAHTQTDKLVYLKYSMKIRKPLTCRR